MTIIEAPTNCPSCSSVLEEVNHLLYCRNAHCGEKVAKLIEHFAKTLKIKGLGPKSIAKLDIRSLEEIYELTAIDIAEALGSEKLSAKLVEELQRSESAPLNVLLPAFSIPLIGKTAANKLSKVCIDIDEIDYDICREAGLGEKSTANLLQWLEMEFYQVSMLPFTFKFVRSENKPVNTSVNTVCITGKLISYKTKAEAHAALEAVGLNVKSSLTKDVTILVNESGIESAKTKKARDAGVQIVTNLKILTGE
jgi:DNA ligase (NAD+)|tara:strand:+ start:3049 stop:3804 length:756 start_codon:yes stop_codon:yes gene_type:complete